MPDLKAVMLNIACSDQQEDQHLRLQVQELLRDRRNVELLRLLRDNPRLGTSELARCVGMSAPAVRERVLRLEEAGVIAGCRLELDPAALGYAVCAFRAGAGRRRGN